VALRAGGIGRPRHLSVLHLKSEILLRRSVRLRVVRGIIASPSI
jgi:hypothetical protein